MKFSLWFGLSERVDRRTYVLTGAGLMFFKYLVDAAVVWSYTHRWWSPLDYVSPLWSVRTRREPIVPSCRLTLP